MVPTFDGGDDVIRVGGPDEGLRMVIGFFDEAVDRRLELDDRAEDAALETAPGEKPSTALSQEQEVGVKWKTKRRWRSSHALTFGCLCVA